MTGMFCSTRNSDQVPSILTQLLPDYKHLEQVVRVIDVTEASRGSMLHIHMNAELGEAIGYLGEAYSAQIHGENWPKPVEPMPRQEVARYDDSYWRWRMYMAERIAAQLDGERLGVKAAYVIGSTNSGTAGPGSDIDLIIHVDQDPEKCALLKQWLDGWSKALAEMNYLKTGYNSEGLLDVHFITDEDLAKKSSFAAKIGAITDPRPAAQAEEQTGLNRFPPQRLANRSAEGMGKLSCHIYPLSIAGIIK